MVKHMSEIKEYDIAIIGGGPAGLTAGIYASRARLSAVLFEKASYGGQVMLTERIENYPGFRQDTGMGLADKLYQHAQAFGLKSIESEVMKIEDAAVKEGRGFKITDKKGHTYNTLSIIITTGADWRKLGVPGEKKFQGKGVSYCATCDGPLYKDKEVVVVGGGNAAVEEALFLARFVKRLTLVHRRSMLRATKILQEELLKSRKVELKLESVLTDIKGDKFVDSVSVENVKTKKKEKIACSGVFLFIGQDPNSGFLKGLLELDEHGHIVTDEYMRTSKEGIFAAGDVRKKALRQIVTAASDGAIAAYSIEQYIRKLKGEEYK